MQTWPPSDHIQAIANPAGFHFGFIEQGGSSLYPSPAQRVTHPEVLRILLSIGPTETSHFRTWHDKAGNAVRDPLAPLTDSTTTGLAVPLVFPNVNLLNSEDFQANLIMPEPCPFLDHNKFPRCSIIRPTQTAGVAMGAVNGLTADGLFIGQSKAFFELLQDLASDADAAQRGLSAMRVSPAPLRRPAKYATARGGYPADSDALDQPLSRGSVVPSAL